VKNLNRKKHGKGERDSTILMTITVGVLLYTRFLDTIDRPFSRWKESIYTGSVCWIELQCPALFKHSITYLRDG